VKVLDLSLIVKERAAIFRVCRGWAKSTVDRRHLLPLVDALIAAVGHDLFSKPKRAIVPEDHWLSSSAYSRPFSGVSDHTTMVVLYCSGFKFLLVHQHSVELPCVAVTVHGMNVDVADLDAMLDKGVVKK
jgi:hypothetical protein